jgi:hypothetical protein
VLFGTVPALSPVRAASQRALGDLLIEARQPGLNFASSGLVLNACVSVANDSPRAVGVAETKAGQLGAATVVLSLPSDILPNFSSSILPLVQIVVASSDGQYFGYGGLKAFDRGWAAVVATAFAVLLFGAIFSLRYDQLGKSQKPWQAWFAGLFTGPDRDPSLSLFQVFFWTVITVWGFAYVYIVSGDLLSLTGSMMALLGIAGTGSVLARWIGVNTSSGDVHPAPGAPPQTQPDRPFDFARVLSTNGSFDLLKLQLFVFTIMIGAYVIWRIADTGAFPDLDTNTLLLLGISQGVYIGGKFTGTTALNRAQATKLELDLRVEEKKNLETELANLNTRKKQLEDRKGSRSDEETKELASTDADIKNKQDRLNALGTKIDALRRDLDKAVKDLGLITS